MSSSSKRSKDLLHRLMILEKFVELKSNECAYYRSKVHLMQINPMIIDKSTLKNDENKQRKSISDETEIEEEFDSNSTTIDVPERKSILKSPKESISIGKTQQKSSFVSSPVQRIRRDFLKRSTDAFNQNYADDIVSHADNQHLLEQILDCYAKKHHQTKTSRSDQNDEKGIQCNEKDFLSIESTLSNPSLIIRLPRRFIETFVNEQKKKSHRSKLKVQFSSDLIHKLAQSVPSLTATTTTMKTFDKDHSQNKAVLARVEMKTRLPSTRHLCRTKSVQLDGNIRPDVRQKKRHIHRCKSSSGDENLSPTDSVSNVTQVQDSPSSSNDENRV